MTTALLDQPKTDEAPLAEQREESLPPSWSSRLGRIVRAPWFILLSITIFGGILRFSFLDRPAIWGDEAMTHARTCGSYQDLIDILQFNGFVPLHYEAYWWIAQGLPISFNIDRQPVQPIQTMRMGHVSYTKPKSTTQPVETKRTLIPHRPIVRGGMTMTPFMMRFLPALAGTLMIPAMYFLARQIAARRTALVAALVTCCSAYLLNYSRDAKMYMELWLFVPLSVACLLWWIRVRTRIAWLCWVASSLAMCGVHAPGMMIVGIELVIFLTLDRQWWPTALALLGGLVFSGLVVGQSKIFGSAIHARDAILTFSLVLGILIYIARRGSHQLIPAAFFTLGLVVILAGPLGYYRFFNHYVDRLNEYGWDESGLQWVDSYNRGRDGFDLVTFASTAFLISWEWPRIVDERYLDVRALRLLRGSIYVIVTLLALGLIPWRKVHPRRSPVKFAWLITWLVVPAYAVYCYSTVPKSATPMEWLDSISHAPLPVAGIGLALLAGWFVLAGNNWKQRTNETLAAALAAACVFAICLGIYFHMRAAGEKAIHDGLPWHSIWMPRYLGVAWPALAIVVSVLLARLPTRAFRAIAIGFFVAVNLTLFGARVFAGSEPPVDRIARDVWDSQPQNNGGTFRAYTNCTDWFGMAPGLGAMYSPPWRYYMLLNSGLAVSPSELRSLRMEFDRTHFKTFNDIRPSAIAYDVGKNPQLDRIVVWDRVDFYRADNLADDPLKSSLAQNWRKIDEQTYFARDHWTWQALFKCRRREYVRTSPPKL